ncbi:hypothetical protein D3C72_2391770 [compost metagenome]
MNSGGSPGSGSGWAGKSPIDPQGVAVPPPPKVPLSPTQLATMKSVAPFCEECEKCKEGACEI